MNKTELMSQIDQFETHYQYDSTYMRDLLNSSQAAYEKFSACMPLVNHHELLSHRDYWIVKLTAMHQEDCGSCVQLLINIAREAAIDSQPINAVIAGPDRLTQEDKQLYDYVVKVTLNKPSEDVLSGAINNRYTNGQLLEMGIVIATCKLFPTIKRSAGYAKSCQLMQFEFDAKSAA